MTDATHTHSGIHVSPAEVFDALKAHILVDGFHLVMDLDKSKGSWIVDARDGRRYLDFYTFFATTPLGHNHPGLCDPEFEAKLGAVAVNKTANSDIYTTAYAEWVKTFGDKAAPAFLPKLFWIDGGSLAVENTLKAAFDWKVRKNLAQGKGEKGSKVIHFKEAFHGRSGYTMSLTNTADPRKYMYFPKFDWPRIINPKVTFPCEGANLAAVEAVEQQAVAQILEAVRQNPDDIACLIIEPIQGEGGDNHFRPEFMRKLRELADEHDFLLIFDEVQTGFGATGKWWGFEHYGVQPDIIAFGKKTQCCGIAAGNRLDEVGQRVQGPVPDQQHLGRKPGGHGARHPDHRDHARGEPGGALRHPGRAAAQGPPGDPPGLPRAHLQPARQGPVLRPGPGQPRTAQQGRGQGPGTGHDHAVHRRPGPALPHRPERAARGPGPGRGAAAQVHPGRHRLIRGT